MNNDRTLTYESCSSQMVFAMPKLREYVMTVHAETEAIWFAPRSQTASAYKEHPLRSDTIFHPARAGSAAGAPSLPLSHTIRSDASRRECRGSGYANSMP